METLGSTYITVFSISKIRLCVNTDFWHYASISLLPSSDFLSHLNVVDHATVNPLVSTLLTLYSPPSHGVFGITNRQSRSPVVRRDSAGTFTLSISKL